MDASTAKKMLRGRISGCIVACIAVVLGLTVVAAAGGAKAWAESSADQEQPLTTASGDAGVGAASQSIADGDYAIRSLLGENAALDVAGASKQGNANVQLDAWDRSAGQKWHFAYNVDGGYYTITSKQSGMALTAVSGKSGANVCVAKNTDAVGQRWVIEGKRGAYAVKSAEYGQLVLDIKGASGKSGANARVSKKNGSKAQTFDIISLSVSVPKSSAKIANGAYVIKTSSGKAIDVVGSSIAKGANVQQYKRNGSYAQRFWIESDGKGYYRIINVGSGLALDATGGDVMTKANVRQRLVNGGPTQLWSASKSGKSYIFTNKASGNVLEVADGSNESGANVQANVLGASSGQAFRLVKSTLLDNGTVVLRGAFSPSRVIDVPGASKSAGVALQMYSGNDSAAQRFVVAREGDGFTIRSGVSGRYVAVSDGKIVQRSAKYRWKAKFSTKGKRRGIVFASGDGKTAVTAASSKQSAKLVASALTMKDTQRFLPESTQLIDDGNYMIQSGTGSRVLDVRGGSLKAGANVHIYSKNYTGAQIFEVKHVSNGYYQITCYGSAKSVSVRGNGSKAEGANVQQAAKGRESYKLWKPEILVGGKFAFRNKASGKLLTVVSNKNEDCANVVSASSNGGRGQRWSLEEATVDCDPSVVQRALSRISWKGSSTGYMIAVDLSNHYVIVFVGSAGSWKFYKSFRCTNGGYLTPTVTGDYYVGSKGYSFSDARQTYTCYYWTQFYGDYLFHSVLYYYQSSYIKDGTLGDAISHGCIRLAIENAKWIQDYIPSGTHVYTYY